MILEPQGGPLAVLLPGTLDEAKKKRQYLFKGDFENMFKPTELYCPATDPTRGRRILEPALLVQLGRVEIHLLHQQAEISLRIDKRLEMIAVFDIDEHPGCKDLTREKQKAYLEQKMLAEPVRIGMPYGCHDVKNKKTGKVFCRCINLIP